MSVGPSVDEYGVGLSVLVLGKRADTTLVASVLSSQSQGTAAVQDTRAPKRTFSLCSQFLVVDLRRSTILVAPDLLRGLPNRKIPLPHL